MDRSLYFLFNNKLITSINTGGNYGYGSSSQTTASKISNDLTTTGNKFNINYRGNKFSKGVYDPHPNLPQNPTNERETNRLGIANIIQESKKYPMMQLYPQDFIYLKNFGKYPLNRCIILRRFRNPVDDNLFLSKKPMSSYNKCVSTIIGWIRPEDEELIKFSFNENWVNENKSIREILSEAFGLDAIGSMAFPSGGGIAGAAGAIGSLAQKLSTPFSEYVNYKMLEQLGFLGGNLFDIIGNPNIIKSTKRRGIESEGDPFDNQMDIEFETEYEYRYVDGVDPSTVMLDIIGNGIRMGVEEEKYFLSGGGGARIKQVLDKIAQGKILELVIDVINGLIKVIGTAVENFTKFVSNAVSNPSAAIGDAVNVITGFIKGFAASIIAKHRIKIAASLAWMTGAPSGIWHVSIGNPIDPIISIGNMVLTRTSISLGNELGFNDFPSRVKMEFSLTPARGRGAQMLENMINKGQGRIYYRDASNYPSYKERIKELTGSKSTIFNSNNAVNSNNADVLGGNTSVLDAQLEELRILAQYESAESEIASVSESNNNNQ